MDVRKVALGAVFGAAVAVNAALQSLQDAGCFLIHPPPSKSVSPHRNDARSRPRKLIKLAGDFDGEQASVFSACLPDEDGDSEDALERGDTKEHCRSTDFFQDLIEGKTGSSKTRHSRVKLRAKRRIEGGWTSECRLNDNSEESIENSHAVLSTENKHVVSIQQPPSFPPFLFQMEQSEEAMSAMLQRTTNTVLDTLADAKERREKMLEEMKRLNLPEEQTSLQLVSRFIDALINVSDSLSIVHSALFKER